MGRTGSADLPLHGGTAPRWLFARMVKLGRAIMEVMVDELGRPVVLERLADPYWFQALSCVLGFDWHSSGTTTVTCGALKTALGEGELGLGMVGGKGAASRKTPAETVVLAEKMGLADNAIRALQKASKLAAKVDTAALQDGHPLYHHSLFLTREGEWAVVQQGLNATTGYARRYHWLGATVGDFASEPHTGLQGEREKVVLDLTAPASNEAKATTLDLVREEPVHLKGDLGSLPAALPFKAIPGQARLTEFGPQGRSLPPHLALPRSVNWAALRRAYEFQPTDYEALLLVPGLGPATVRALALVAELIYGMPPSWADPVKYSFAVGGKDGVPYPVDRPTMDRTIEVLRAGIQEAKMNHKEQLASLKRLRCFVPPDYDWRATG